jgi:hypothetical protein
VNKGHGRIETRIITTSEMLNPCSDWPGLAQVYRLQRKFLNGGAVAPVIELQMNLNLGLPACHALRLALRDCLKFAVLSGTSKQALTIDMMLL